MIVKYRNFTKGIYQKISPLKRKKVGIYRGMLKKISQYVREIREIKAKNPQNVYLDLVKLLTFYLKKYIVVTSIMYHVKGGLL